MPQPRGGDVEKQSDLALAGPTGPAVQSQASAPCGKSPELEVRTPEVRPNHIPPLSFDSLFCKLGLVIPALSVSQGCLQDSMRIP